MAQSHSALLLHEYGSPQTILHELAVLQSVGLDAAERLIRQTGELVHQSLGLKRNPLEVSRAGVRATAFAGVIRLDSSVDLEVSPKYANPASSRWREDLLFLSMFTRHGDLLLRHQVSAGRSTANDLTSLAAQVLLRLYAENARTPLKVRRYETFHSFDLEASTLPEDLVIPSEGGFRQAEYRLSRDNEAVATIVEAARALANRVRDISIRNQLLALVGAHGALTVRPSQSRRRLPPRQARWQLLYDFAFELLRGGGLAPAPGAHRLPGFVVNTWQMWQSLISKALRISLGASVVGVQSSYRLGTRFTTSEESEVEATPDVVLQIAGAPLVVDAKYKGSTWKGQAGISSADLYESLSFMDAVGSQHTVLVYPAVQPWNGPVGSWGIQEVVVSSGRRVTAVGINADGISAPGGLFAFANGLAAAVQSVPGSARLLARP